ncbi:MAG: ribonuclease P protein component [Patescibacteria group bacterium]|nr:ribonuclease P protein component [Patescibacteria group bacterium]
MIPKKLRLRVAEFPRETPAAANTEYFLLKVGKNNFGENRIGAVVSTKVSKSAVERNRLRRLALDELYSAALASPKIEKSDLLLIFKPAAAGLSKEKLQSMLHKYV